MAQSKACGKQQLALRIARQMFAKHLHDKAVDANQCFSCLENVCAPPGPSGIRHQLTVPEHQTCTVPGQPCYILTCPVVPSTARRGRLHSEQDRFSLLLTQKASSGFLSCLARLLLRLGHEYCREKNFSKTRKNILYRYVVDVLKVRCYFFNISFCVYSKTTALVSSSYFERCIVSPTVRKGLPKRQGLLLSRSVQIALVDHLNPVPLQRPVEISVCVYRNVAPTQTASSASGGETVFVAKCLTEDLRTFTKTQALSPSSAVPDLAAHFRLESAPHPRGETLSSLTLSSGFYKVFLSAETPQADLKVSPTNGSGSSILTTLTTLRSFTPLTAFWSLTLTLLLHLLACSLTPVFITLMTSQRAARLGCGVRPWAKTF